jgi:phosphoribosylformylglycinamidine cyclo-ligase
VPTAELARTFNMGIGMVVIVRADAGGAIEAALSEAGEEVIPLGAVTERQADGPAITIKGMEEAWRNGKAARN